MTKRVLLGGLVLLLAAGIPALAGPNGGGSIIVHTNDAYEFDDDACDTAFRLPASCAEAGTQVSTVIPTPGNCVWFLAAFVPAATPDVATVYFGVNFDDTNLKISSTSKGPCGEGLEAPDAGWVSNTTGTTWGFNTAQSATLLPFYWFLVRPKVTPVPTGAYWCSTANPTGGYAAFISMSLEEDRVTRFGCVHWFEAGSNTCPVPPPTGACCLDNTVCQIVGSASECTGQAGVYQGDNTTCDNKCSACCYWAGDPPLRRCVVTGESDCLTGSWNAVIADDGLGHMIGSSWSGLKEGGVGHECASEPSQASTKWYCGQQPIATKPTTWGQLKAIYR